jgi:drug/metabolite transporter (DMT)-like permease
VGWGIVAAIAAACCYEAGYALQVLEARSGPRAAAPRPSLLGSIARRPRWLAGTLLSAAGAGLQLLALSLAPLTVVQPTLALGLLALLAIARVVLGEHPGRRELAGVVAIVAGVTVVGLAAPPHIGRSPAGAGLAVELAILAALLLVPYVVEATSRLALGGAAAGDALAALALKLVADELHRGRIGAAAGWGAMAVASGVGALTAEMSALQRLPASRVAPAIVACQVLVPVLTAPLLLGEGWSATPAGGAILGAAVAVVALGAVVLASSRQVGDVLAVAESAEALEHDGGGRR